MSNVFLVNPQEKPLKFKEVCGWTQIPVLSAASDAPDSAYILEFNSEQKLELFSKNNPKQRILVDFESGETLHRIKTSGKQQPLARALGLNKGVRNIWDATGGLGGDSFVLASLDCTVQISERHPAVFLLLFDGLRRALESEKLVKTSQASHQPLSKIAQRIQLHWGSAVEHWRDLPHRPEVIYCDPMYPQTKKSALSRLEMQMFEDLIGPDQDQSDLVEAALKSASRYVVIKRPLQSPPLWPGPIHQYSGSTTRYDRYAVTP